LASGFDRRVSDLSARWVAAVVHRPRLVLLVSLAITVLLGLYAARNLGVNADLDALIDPEVDFRVRHEDFQRSFRALDVGILVLVDGESASAATLAANRLAEELARQDDLFAEVIPLGGGEFFERNALLFLEPEELDALADRLSQLQPFLAQLGRDSSVVGISNLLARGVEEARSGRRLALDLPAALDRVSGSVEAAARMERAPDPWGDSLVGGSLSEGARHRVISVQARSDYDDLLYAEPAVEAIREAAERLGLDERAGVRVRVTGDQVLSFEEQKVIAEQARTVALVALGLFAAAIWFGVRSFRVVLSLLVGLVAALVWTNAFAAATVGALNQVSAAFNVLIVGLGGEFGIHVCMRYAELCRQGAGRSEALVGTGRSIGTSLVSSAGTTAIGFLVFVPTRYWGVAQLGLISGAGVILSLVASLTVLPAMLQLISPEGRWLDRPTPPWLARLEHWPVAHAGAVRVATVLLLLASLALLPMLRFEINPLHVRDPGTESVQAFQDLLSRSGTSPWTADVVTPGLVSARNVAERIEALPGVKETRTLHDFVPARQDEKRALLEDASLLLPPPAPPAPAPDLASRRQALLELGDALRRLVAEDGADPQLAASARRLSEAIDGFLEGPAASRPGPAFERLSQNVVGSLPRQLRQLERALSPDVVTLDGLPPEIREQMLADDGRARVQVVAEKDLGEDVALRRFVETVRSVAPHATGPAIDMFEWAEVTSDAMRQAMVLGIVATMLFLLVLWRNLWDTLLAITPLVLAIVVACGVMVLLGIHFNFANIVVLPMLLGMGVDNGIHLVHRHRTEPMEVDVLHTSTARAVFFAALTTVLCFGSLAFSSHLGMAAIGKFLTLGVGLTFLSYVVVLPAVLEWDDRREGRRASREEVASRRDE